MKILPKVNNMSIFPHHSAYVWMQVLQIGKNDDQNQSN